jgi:hypothetical protein
MKAFEVPFKALGLSFQRKKDPSAGGRCLTFLVFLVNFWLGDVGLWMRPISKSCAQEQPSVTCPSPQVLQQQ